MLATIVHANPAAAQVLFLFAALVFVVAFFVNLLREPSPTWLVVIVASVLLSVGLLFI